MDDEQLNFKVKSGAEKDYLGNESAVRLDGKTQTLTLEFRLNQETNDADSCDELR